MWLNQMLPWGSVSSTEEWPVSNKFFTSILSPSFDAANKAVKEVLYSNESYGNLETVGQF